MEGETIDAGLMSVGTDDAGVAAGAIAGADAEVAASEAPPLPPEAGGAEVVATAAAGDGMGDCPC
jgi:hypothetical protein